MAPSTHTLTGIPDIRRFFRTSETPVYFVSATAFNLLGMDRWVRGFRYVNYYDSFDGHHPHVFVPREIARLPFESIEEICNYLLAHKETADLVRAGGDGGRAVFLMFDEETEGLAGELGLTVAHPSAGLRRRLDSKIETTRLGNEAGVPSVPNVLGRASSYAQLLGLARRSALGTDLVVQTPYGDSGQTTFFIDSEDDWSRHASEITGGAEVKVMRRIEPRELAIEAVVTRHGTVVGPLMTELAGFPELTPYLGGWCGNDISPGVVSPAIAELARARTRAMGERLAAEGYRGYFELDFLQDASSGEMFLGEMNPRLTGASPITNVNALAYGDMPLFLFHLLEFMDVDYELDVDAVNARWATADHTDAWSQFVLKQTEDLVEVITAAPATGIWRLQDDGTVAFARRDTDWHSIASEDEAFYLRIASVGDLRYRGADLGILVTRGRMMDAEHELRDRTRAWIDGIKAQFASVPPPAEPEAPSRTFASKLL